MKKSEECRACAVEAGWLDLFGTLGQAVFRVFLGLLSGSMALAAQGIYSVGDFLTKCITLAGVKLAQRPPSKHFPFGYGKVQFLSSAIVGFSVVGGGFYLGVRSLLLVEVDNDVPNGIALLGVLLSALVSALMSHYLLCVSRRNNSIAFEAAAMDNRTDAISSVAVLIGIGIANLGLPSADRVAAIVVSVLVVRAGGKIAFDAVRGLLDVSVPLDVLADIRRICGLTLGIQEVKLVRGRSIGENWEIYVQVAIAETVTAGEAQDTVDLLRSKIHNQFPQVQYVWILTSVAKRPSADREDYWSSHVFKVPLDGRGKDGETTDPEATG
ncbi:MAG: cation transporter [Alphaproteobacteria bacterium]|nr:cation transporter [Alphaproteobacteria bacterium]